jgi:hypothetical protein
VRRGAIGIFDRLPYGQLTQITYHTVLTVEFTLSQRAELLKYGSEASVIVNRSEKFVATM